MADLERTNQLTHYMINMIDTNDQFSAHFQLFYSQLCVTCEQFIRVQSISV